MLRKVICSVFTVYQLSSGSSRILLQHETPGGNPGNPQIDPVAIDPVAIDPVAIDPAPADPVPVDPVTVDPAPADPAPADPIPPVPHPEDPVPVPPADPHPEHPVDPVPAPVDPEPQPPADPQVPPPDPEPQAPADPQPPAPVDPLVPPADPQAPADPVAPPVDPQPQNPIDPQPQNPIDPQPQNPIDPIDPQQPIDPEPHVEVLPPAGYAFGAFGQLCPISLDNKCQETIDIVTDPETVLCDRQNDCCMCAQIECAPNCNRFYAGDSSVYGVENIIVSGNPDGNGAIIDCHGSEACRGATIYGTNIIGVDCNGDKSCQGATISIIDPKPGFILDCAGTDSCDGLNIDLEFTGPLQGYMCNPDIVIKNMLQISGIYCANNRACRDMQVTINNDKGCDQVLLQNVECIQSGSCNGARFELIGDVDIENCECGPSCDNAMGLSKCFENLQSVICSDPQSCMKQTKRIINPMNGFKFVCGNVESCKNAEFIMTLNKDIENKANHPITEFEALIFGGLNSGKGATFIFDNKQGMDESNLVPIILELQRVECGGYGSCEDMTIVRGQHMFIDEIICAADACYGCMIKEHIEDSLGEPCDPQQMERPIQQHITPPITPPVPPPRIPPQVIPVTPPQVVAAPV